MLRFLAVKKLLRLLARDAVPLEVVLPLEQRNRIFRGLAELIGRFFDFKDPINIKCCIFPDALYIFFRDLPELGPCLIDENFNFKPRFKFRLFTPQIPHFLF